MYVNYCVSSTSNGGKTTYRMSTYRILEKYEVPGALVAVKRISQSVSIYSVSSLAAILVVYTISQNKAVSLQEVKLDGGKITYRMSTYRILEKY